MKPKQLFAKLDNKILYCDDVYIKMLEYIRLGHPEWQEAVNTLMLKLVEASAYHTPINAYTLVEPVQKLVYDRAIEIIEENK